jgi:hypothetical protein
MAQDPHQMKDVRMIGVCRERLLAADLSVEIPAALHMAKACLIELGGRLGSSGGSPAFATAHQRISCGQDIKP